MSEPVSNPKAKPAAEEIITIDDFAIAERLPAGRRDLLRRARAVDAKPDALPDPHPRTAKQWFAALRDLRAERI